ncbi:MAG: hypothetical protein IAF02_03395 [Anaerolineae bacterium]|nr:hypothetical protein [Anaerolineae bacterium]
MIRAFSRTLSSNEQGIILAALAVMAHYAAKQGDLKAAVMLALLVTQHHASWHETKTQVEPVLMFTQKLTPQQLAQAETEAQQRQKNIWQLTAELLADLK